MWNNTPIDKQNNDTIKYLNCKWNININVITVVLDELFWNCRTETPYGFEQFDESIQCDIISEQQQQKTWGWLLICINGLTANTMWNNPPFDKQNTDTTNALLL